MLICETAGDIFRLVVLGQPIIFLTSHEDASVLFDKRGSVYSNRPPLTMLREWCVTILAIYSTSIYTTDYIHYNSSSCDASRMVPRYGPESRVPRKMMKEILKPSSLSTYDDILKDESLKLLWGLFKSPDDYPRQLRR